MQEPGSGRVGGYFRLWNFGTAVVSRGTSANIAALAVITRNTVFPVMMSFPSTAMKQPCGLLRRAGVVFVATSAQVWRTVRTPGQVFKWSTHE